MISANASIYQQKDSSNILTLPFPASFSSSTTNQQLRINYESTLLRQSQRSLCRAPNNNIEVFVAVENYGFLGITET